MKNEIEEGGHPQLIGENDVAERERERETQSRQQKVQGLPEAAIRANTIACSHGKYLRFYAQSQQK